MAYTAEVTREGRWWMVAIPEIDGLTQARRLSEVKIMAREFIAVTVGCKLDDVEVVVVLKEVEGVSSLPDRIRQLVTEREQAAELEAAAASHAHDLAVDLVHAKVPLRDVGEILGVSHQRVHQLVS